MIGINSCPACGHTICEFAWVTILFVKSIAFKKEFVHACFQSKVKGKHAQCVNGQCPQNWSKQNAVFPDSLPVSVNLFLYTTSYTNPFMRFG